MRIRVYAEYSFNAACDVAMFLVLNKRIRAQAGQVLITCRLQVLLQIIATTVDSCCLRTKKRMLLLFLGY
jgi:hypothetical protein